MPIFRGRQDVNIVGVVGSDGDDDERSSPRVSKTRVTSTNTGVQHHGRGRVTINGKRQQ